MKKLLTILVSLLLLWRGFTVPALAVDVPAPSIPSSDYLVGAFYFPAWRLDIKDPGWHWSWISIDMFPDRKPLLGYYDEGNPEVADWEIKWASEHGVNFFIFEWQRCLKRDRGVFNCDHLLNKPIVTEELRWRAALHDGFLKAKYKNDMNFAIMLTDNLPQSQSFGTLDDLRDNLMPYLINTYFKQPNYLKVNNKPVLYMFAPHDLVAWTGSEALATQAVQIMKEETQKSGFSGLILLGRDPSYSQLGSLASFQKLKNYGFDYSFAYSSRVVYADGKLLSLSPTEAEAITSQKQSYQYLKANSPLPFIITASPFWDNYPALYRLAGRRWDGTAAGFKQTISNAKTLMNSSTDPLTKKMIIVDAWNEYSEGHYIAPTNKTRFDFLMSIRETLTRKNNTPDHRLPSQLGLGPYDSLYQKYLIDHVRTYAQASRQTYNFLNQDQFIDVVDTGFDIMDTDRLTFGGWVKTGLTGYFIPFAKSGSFQAVVTVNGSGHCVVGTVNNAWYSGGSPSPTVAAWPAGKIKPNQWHQIVCVYNGANVTSYIDGVKIKTSAGQISGKMEKKIFRLHLGYMVEKWSPGSVANFVIKNTRLNEAEVLSLYQTTRPTVTGDLNNDSQVNSLDYNLLITNFGKTGAPGFTAADIDKTGKVNIFDYNLLVTNYGK